MADLVVKSIFPASGEQGVPLGTTPSVTLEGLDYDEVSLSEGMFLEGPDTDQFVGPGQLYQRYPNNVSQGDLNDFLKSPGYMGIVPGSGIVTNDGVDTIVTFQPNMVLAPLTEYRVNLTGVLDSVGADIDGFFTTAFTTGSGSIVEVPSSVSSSVLSQAASEAGATTSADTPMTVAGAAPADHSIENAVDTDEIIVEFNKDIDAASVAGKVSVEAVPATDHPNASTHGSRDLAFTTEVEGSRLKIKI